MKRNKLRRRERIKMGAKRKKIKNNREKIKSGEDDQTDKSTS